MNQSAVASSYDQIPYPGNPYPATHPDLLAVIGTLCGVDAPAVHSCHVLEVGCGDGSNIIPMAIALPHAEFVGIDLAEKPIRQAQMTIDRTKLTNITVRAMDLLDLSTDFGQFDYIIAHGFYSWVPALLQDKLLEVCHGHLTPNGIAFISYNTFPAAHFRRACRDAMLFHLKTMGESSDQVHRGISVLTVMIDSIEDKDTWKAVVRDELNRISQRDENVVYHDELNEIYCPAYFADFIASAARHNLQFLGEAALHEIVSFPLKPELEEMLRRFAGGDATAYHQYLDFIQFRGFRRTLLCRSEIRVKRDLQQERLATLLLASPLRETSRKPDGKITFTNQQGHGFVETDHAVMIAAIRRLEEIWPRAESFDRLLSHVVNEVAGQTSMDVQSTLMDILSLLISKTLLQCRTQDIPVPATVQNRPVASALARLEAENGTLLTTLMHTKVDVQDQLARRFLLLLDGTRDRRSLAAWLRGTAPGISIEKISKQVDIYLQEFRRLGLLIAI